MVEIPKLPIKKCGLGRVPYAVFAYHTVLGFPVPIPNVDVRFISAFGSTSLKTGLGGLAEDCFIPPPHIKAYVRKEGLDFGTPQRVLYIPGEPSKTTWTEVGSSWETGKAKLFRAKAKIGCDEVSAPALPIAATNFKFDATPNITVLPVTVSTPAGSFTIKPGILEDGKQYLPKFAFFLGGVKIAEGSVPESGKIDHNLKSLKDIPGIKDLLGKDVELKVEITTGDCKFTGTRTISLPSPPTLPKPCSGSLSITTPTGLSIKDHIADFLSKIPLGTNPNAFPALFIKIESIVDGVKKDIAIELLLDGEKVTLTEPKSNRSQDLIRIVKTLGTKAFDTEHEIKIIPLLDCAIDAVSFSIPPLIPALPKIPTPEVPKPPTCELWETAANISIPSILKPPFTLKVSNANWICKDTGKKTLVDAIAEVSIGEREFSLPIKSGSGILTLTESDLKPGVGIPGIPKPPELPTPPKLPSVCEKTGKLGEPGKYFVTISEVQSYLDICYPGQKHEAEYAPAGSWYGAFKIIRGKATRYPAGSYFWATTWEGIRSTI
ncbi:MAG: hypothetical protein Q8J68_08005 [Methanolobus sp.]|uniref:hypothetical protein n=1 Tax=Methanolobus sp. TaxID=1874737 RepID=UPI00272F53CC|nr:hypothetical protein [Methanolobus sp.]MDP2217212.1 hypothetical protein [Methanolobus sp.]